MRKQQTVTRLLPEQYKRVSVAPGLSYRSLAYDIKLSAAEMGIVLSVATDASHHRNIKCFWWLAIALRWGAEQSLAGSTAPMAARRCRAGRGAEVGCIDPCPHGTVPVSPGCRRHHAVPEGWKARSTSCFQLSARREAVEFDLENPSICRKLTLKRDSSRAPLPSQGTLLQLEEPPGVQETPQPLLSPQGPSELQLWWFLEA